jgi:hypothetical protein
MIDPNLLPTRLNDDETGRAVVDVHQVVRDLVGQVLADQIVQHVYLIRGGFVPSVEIRKPDATAGD